MRNIPWVPALPLGGWPTDSDLVVSLPMYETLRVTLWHFNSISVFLRHPAAWTVRCLAGVSALSVVYQWSLTCLMKLVIKQTNGRKAGVVSGAFEGLPGWMRSALQWLCIAEGGIWDSLQMGKITHKPHSLHLLPDTLPPPASSCCSPVSIRKPRHVHVPHGSGLALS